MRRLRVRHLGILAISVCLAALAGPVTTASAEPAATARYVVQTSSASATTAKVDRLRAAKAPIGRRYHSVMHGFSARLTEAQVRQLQADPTVEAVVPDIKVHASGPTVSASSQQTGATWGLDRIDERTGLDGRYFYDSTGAGVTAYVIDTGIRMDISEFDGPGGSRATSGYDFVDGDDDASDCASNYVDDPDLGLISHGTHVAATIAGNTYGVAKKASIVSLRVLDCDGTGYGSDVIAALDWVTAHRTGPSVVNFSLGGPASPLLDAAVEDTIAAGVPVVTAAGNDSEDACDQSPARAPAALTVGATDRSDHRSWFSNYGRCVDLFAPGEDITSAGTRTTHSTLVLSGTSMATPHVTGAVARYLQSHPTATSAQVNAAILGSATTGVVADAQSANRLLFLSSADAPRAPGVPLSVIATRSDKSKTATIRWSPPTSNGGASITGYQVVRTGKDAAGHASATVKVGTTARSYTFKSLRAGTTYTLTVRARNQMGLGSTATAKTAITALPGRPKVTSAKSGAKKGKTVSISVKWSKPKSGGPAKHYVITATRNSTGSVKTVTVSSSARRATIKSLKKNKSYTVRVRASNDSGKGSTSKWKKSVKAR